MIGKTGLSALINLAAQAELDFPAMEVMSLGRSATSDAEAELELGGHWLLYRVSLYGETRLAVALLDGIESPRTILRSPDTQAGWDVLGRLIHSMEKYEVRDLSRPILVGDPITDDPQSCWVIS